MPKAATRCRRPMIGRETERQPRLPRPRSRLFVTIACRWAAFNVSQRAIPSIVISINPGWTLETLTRHSYSRAYLGSLPERRQQIFAAARGPQTTTRPPLLKTRETPP